MYLDDLTQKSRLLQINTSLGEEQIFLTKLEGKEEISALYTYQAELFSLNKNIRPINLIGTFVAIKISNNNEISYINGYVSKFTAKTYVKSERFRRYMIEIVPELWFLDKNNDYRIFQEMTVIDIVKKLLDEQGLDYEVAINITKEFKIRECCVQYNESTYNFIARILQSEGIYFFFQHSDISTKLIITDSNIDCVPCVSNPVIFKKGKQLDGKIHSWQENYRFKTANFMTSDYDFKFPTKPLQRTISNVDNFAKSEMLTLFEYPGNFNSENGPDSTLRVTADIGQVDQNVVMASSDIFQFYAGGTFELTEHATTEANKKYLITKIVHKAVDETYLSDSSCEQSYKNNIECIPLDINFRPKKIFKLPKIPGMQTAIVAGPELDEIYTDDYGRIKVKFFWDNYSHDHKQTSCWIRVSQSLAGNNWGTQFIPRIGQEVIVSFLDNNPDKPIILGCVYNGQNDVPFDKHSTGIRTKPYYKSNVKSNELVFNDSCNNELITLNAKKNLNLNVENDKSETIHNNATLQVNNSQTETVAKNLKTSIMEGKYRINVVERCLTCVAKTQVMFKVGESEITIAPNHISINSPSIKINGTSKLNLNGGVIKAKGEKISLN